MIRLFDYLDHHKILKYVYRLFLITVGSVVFAVGFQFFMFPNSIVSGGLSGIGMIINRLTGLPVGAVIIVLNIPLFLIAWRHFGFDYLVGSIAGMFLSSIFVDILAVTRYVATEDMLLACIIGGAIKGVGMGIIFYAGGSTGGIDILAKVVRQKYPHFNIGSVILWIDIAIIVAYAAIFNLPESAMYAGVAMFVVTRVIDLVLYGFNSSVVCYIISDKNEEIVDEIVSGNLHRGVTILKGQGAYSHQDKQIIMCVVKHSQITEMRRLIRRIDDHSFVIVTDAKNVFGKGFENIAENG